LKKCGLVLILFVALMFVCVAIFNTLQTSHFRNLLDFMLLLVALGISPSILIIVIIAVVMSRKECD
jgi:hypothetical protein